MKKIIILLIFVFLTSISFAETINHDQLKLVDEIFLQMEYLKQLNKARRKYMSKPRRHGPSSSPYAGSIWRNKRKLVVLLKHYELRYQEKFDIRWKYEDWLKENPL